MNYDFETIARSPSITPPPFTQYIYRSSLAPSIRRILIGLHDIFQWQRNYCKEFKWDLRFHPDCVRHALLWNKRDIGTI